MQKIGDYKIEELLGEGTQGQFWLARTPARLPIDDELVAVKTIQHPASEDEFARLADYLRRYAGIESPFLVDLLEIGQQGNVVFLVARYRTGGSMAKPAKPLTRVDALRAVGRAALGAHALHEVGIPHRSIRTGNILLDDDGARLGELGITQFLNPGLTITGANTVTTIEYLSPELIQGHQASRASDIWALGATLHEALTGSTLFPAMPTDSLVGALRHLLNERPALSDALRNAELKIIESAVAADPADRPLTAEELADEMFVEADRQARQAVS